MKRIILLLALAALAGCAVRINEQSVFRPEAHTPMATTVEELSLWPIDRLRAAVPDAEAENGFLGEGDTRIAYTLVTRASTRADAHRPLIVYCGGNAGNRFNSGVFYALKALPYGDVLLFDYPGYGDSPGQPTAQSMERMAPAVSSFAVQRAGERPLVFWGHSLGGFICSRIVRDTPQTDGVVLEATARTAQEVAQAWRPWYAFFISIDVQPSLGGYDVAGALKDTHAPILVLGARRDRTLPVPLARSLAEALRGEGANVTYVEYPHATHVDITRQPDFPAAATPFFASVESRS